MLMDKYAGDEKVRVFAIDLIGLYSPKVQLKVSSLSLLSDARLTYFQAEELYLNVIIDILNPKPGLSEQLLSFSSAKTPEVAALNLLSLPPRTLCSHRLASRTAKTLANPESEKDATTIRQSYSRMVEQTLLLMGKVKQQKQCERITNKKPL